MRKVKDCALRIKGRCKKLGHLCCLNPNSDLYSCTELVRKPKKPAKKGKKKR
ncbi:hypothetical protein ES703_14327 [subsurface metagenome]